VLIRSATPDDAESITAVLAGIASEQVYTAISRPWSAGEQRLHLISLSPRETIYVAESEQRVIGYQTLELWAPTLDSMSHVGQLGTFLQPEWRRQGVGVALFQASLEFARQHEFGKFVIQVRASNTGAQRFYQRLGFRECGHMNRQVRIGGKEDDEILMEFFL
jgi:ribosomal protein S18 acetylase RimI-like enzyme